MILSYTAMDQVYRCSAKKLPHLQSIQFGIQVQLFQKSTNEMISHYTRTFSTPYWLNGPFGCKEVCVDFHQLYGHIHMFSLPFTFTNGGLVRTIDIANMQFNTFQSNSN